TWGSRASGDEEGPLARGQRDRHHVPAHELSSATRLDLAAHAHGLVLEQEARVGAGVDHPGELEELTEADGLLADGDGFGDHASIVPGLARNHTSTSSACRSGGNTG